MKQQIFTGDSSLKSNEAGVQGEYVKLLGDVFYQIKNYDAMTPFFMSIVSSSNHWLFISSTGGLSAGRVSTEQALFPYYTEEKLAENSENTGSKTILLVRDESRLSLWEPFSIRQQGMYRVQRNLYKNVTGTAVIFEECNLDLDLVFRYAWRTSDAFGFVKTSWLVNSGDATCQVEFLDGLQNLLPANVASQTQNIFSVLLDAYKRCELDPQTGLAILALNSTLTDLAEPSESLLATTVFQLGLEPRGFLLSNRQLERFRRGAGIETESQVRGQRCAYFVHASLELPPGEERSWRLVAEVNQDSPAIVRLAHWLSGDRASLQQALEEDLEANRINLEMIVAAADGLQRSNHPLHCAHHFANTMFNAMRGGIFESGYHVASQDFRQFAGARNQRLLVDKEEFFTHLPEQIEFNELLRLAEASGEPALIRVTYAYLPLSFSRRHGDPSRPWNRFVIQLKNPYGSRQLSYEGNWRDIFQNWEALAFSYPEYVESMICTFLNATTVDGYNPYRITRLGVDWEVPEPNNPWANIGYWSDHQIIYLQKLLEISAQVHPGKLLEFLNKPLFSYANVPYRIKPYAELLQNPYSTIDFDWSLEHEIERRVKENGSDGKLLQTPGGQVLQVTLAEKLLTLLLAKLANFVPEGGIWMNTQRPEWNDANNALVGKGLSVVTLAYLRRTLVFCKELVDSARRTQPGMGRVQVSAEIAEYTWQVKEILTRFQDVLAGPIGDEQRRQVLDALGQAGSDFRGRYYAQGLSGEIDYLPLLELESFLDLALQYVEHSLRANRRSDALYHAYNILKLSPGKTGVARLYEMLEGQVAILSSGMLSPTEAGELLDSLRHSRLYQPSSQSYLLYPDREMTPFLAKNNLPPAQVAGMALVEELVKAQDRSLLVRDDDGNLHFAGHIRNQKDVSLALDLLCSQPRFEKLVEAEKGQVEALFEDTFQHDAFTGRSGTFFGYEGLGSVYWHMVSKLLLAVQENVLLASQEPARDALLRMYQDIRQGQGFNKTAEAFGAFPTDPYSHTPKEQGAKQPGMTGMVKEEILARQVELGYTIGNGCLAFRFPLLDYDEFLKTSSLFAYWDVHGKKQSLEVPLGCLVYTICQVLVIVQEADKPSIRIYHKDGSSEQIEGHVLDAASSRHIFQRDGQIHHLVVTVPSTFARLYS
jgi:hypothetical protein